MIGLSFVVMSAQGQVWYILFHISDLLPSLTLRLSILYLSLYIRPLFTFNLCLIFSFLLSFVEVTLTSFCSKLFFLYSIDNFDWATIVVHCPFSFPYYSISYPLNLWFFYMSRYTLPKVWIGPRRGQCLHWPPSNFFFLSWGSDVQVVTRANTLYIGELSWWRKQRRNKGSNNLDKKGIIISFFSLHFRLDVL